VPLCFVCVCLCVQLYCDAINSRNGLKEAEQLGPAGLEEELGGGLIQAGARRGEKRGRRGRRGEEVDQGKEVN